MTFLDFAGYYIIVALLGATWIHIGPGAGPDN